MDLFKGAWRKVVKKHIPTKQRRVKKTKQPAWINENIMSSIKKCDRELLVKQTALMTGQNTNAGSLVRKSKRMYFQQSIDDNKGDPKEIWKALKSGMVLVDFRKAFDIVDHQLLLMKLHLYRVSDPSLSWLNHIFLVANSLSVLIVKDQTLYLSSRGYRKEVS